MKYAGQAGLNVGVRAVGVIFVINAGGQAMANGGDMEDIAKAAAREVVMADFVEGGVKVVVVDGAGRYVRQRFFDENYMGRYLGSNISDVDKNNIRTNIKNHPFLKYWE